MPKAVPMEYVVDVALAYVVKRQQQGRPTTLRQLSKRVGIGVSTVLTLLDEAGVTYYTLSHEENSWTSEELEIAVRTLPEEAAQRAALTVEAVEKSYRLIFGSEEPQPVKMVNPATGEKGIHQAVLVEKSDPYRPYRIEGEQFRQIRKTLLTYDQLLDEAKKRGVPGSAILRAIGGDRLKRPLASEVWRPYVYKGHRYYAKEVLKHLEEAFSTYRWEGYGEKKQRESKEIDRENRQQAREEAYA